MRSVLQPAATAAGSEIPATTGSRLSLLALWLFLFSPILLQPLLTGGPAINLTYFFSAFTSLLWACALHFAVRRPFLLHLALLPFYLTTAADLFLIVAFGDRLSSGYVFTALTDTGQIGDFFATYARPIIFISAALACIYIPGLLAIRRLRIRRSLAMSFGCALVLLATYSAVLVRYVWTGASLSASLGDVQAREMSAPVGAAFQIGLALEVVDKRLELERQRNAYRFNARLLRPKDGAVYVWIVGESSRPQNWSLFGYRRDTNPVLRSVSGVIPLRNMLTTAPHTAVAVPSMLSLQPITDWDSIFAQRSIVSVFNEVGFKTYWLSTQEDDDYAGLVPLVAAEADDTRYYDNARDGAMLDEFRSLLAAAPAGQGLFFVIHTNGSHFPYAKRYPAEFARFATPAATRRDQVVDDYDNSVLYTDWFVSEVIKSLEQRNVPSALIYASDHGENLLDSDTQVIGHGLGNRYDLPTAALVWLSESLRSRSPEMAKMATAHAGMKLSLSDLPHSLLDLAGIDAAGLDRTLSIFDPGFVPRQRWYWVKGNLRSEADSAPKRPEVQQGAAR